MLSNKKAKYKHLSANIELVIKVLYLFFGVFSVCSDSREGEELTTEVVRIT
jgi:hypothetical protein